MGTSGSVAAARPFKRPKAEVAELGVDNGMGLTAASLLSTRPDPEAIAGNHDNHSTEETSE